MSECACMCLCVCVCVQEYTYRERMEGRRDIEKMDRQADIKTDRKKRVTEKQREKDRKRNGLKHCNKVCVFFLILMH